MPSTLELRIYQANPNTNPSFLMDLRMPFPFFNLVRQGLSEVNFKEWIKLKKTISLVLLLIVVLVALIAMLVLYFTTDCG